MKKLPKKIYFSFGFILLLLLGFLLTPPFFSPSETQAAPQETNVDVFTGQIIPAFFASEYDPTEAFSKLAGATVYVFAYDMWGADSMVVGDTIIKTQIRADGTFQAMGLPHAAKYGVYFPYDENGPTEGTGSCLYTDAQCPLNSVFAADCDGDGTDDCCDPAFCTNNTVQPVPFRTPRTNIGDSSLDDGISDVFSYQQKDYPENVGNPTDQTNTRVNLKNEGKPNRRKVFITSSNKLDIENHVNVFPVVPTTVLKFIVNNNKAINDAPLSKELINTPIAVSATRIAVQNDTSIKAQTYPVDTNILSTYYVDGPTITGKTSLNGDFQAYAPPGYYKVEYSLNEHYSGLTFIQVTPSRTYWTDPIVETPANYQSMGSDEQKQHYLWLYYKPLYIWGTVTKTVEADIDTDGDGNFDQKVQVPRVPPGTGTNPAVYVDGGKEYKFLGQTSFYDPVTPFKASVPGLANVGRLTGIYVTRVSGVTGTVEGTIKLVPSDYDPSAASPKKLKICGPSGNQFCRDEERGFLNASGVVPYHLSLTAEPSEGFKIKAVDASGQEVIGAKVTILSKTNYQNKSSWVNTVGGFEPTNDRGETIVPFVSILSRGFGSTGSVSDTDLREDLMVVASLDTLYTGTGEITQSDFSKAVRGVDCDEYGTYVIKITPEAVTSGEGGGGMLWLAKKLNFGISQAFAQSPTEYTPKCSGGLLKITGTLNKVEEKALLARLSPNHAEGTRYERFLKGREESDPHGYSGSGKEEFVYNKNGNFALFIPCGVATWKLMIASGDKIENWSNYSLRAGATSLAESSVSPIGLRTGMDVWMGAKNVDPMLRAVLWPIAVPAQVGSQWYDDSVIFPKVVGNEHSSREIEITVKSLGSDLYSINPPHIHTVLGQACPQIDMTGDILGTAIASAGCNLGYGCAQVIPQLFGVLENMVLNTYPLVETPAVVYLWNLMRNLANVTFVIMLIVVGILIVLRINPQNFNPAALLPQIIFSVFLVNFSLVICQFILDINNILTHTVFSLTTDAIINQIQDPSQYQNVAISGVTAIGGVIGMTVASAAIAAASAGLMVSGVGETILVVAVAFVIFAFLFLVVALGAILIQFMVRYAVLWLCVILAPFSFLIRPFPFGKTINNLWWKIFMAMAFVQLAISVVLAIGMALLVAFPVGGDLGSPATWIEIIIALAIIGIAIKSPGLLASALGGAQGAALMQGVSEGLKGVAGNLQQTFSPEELGMRKGMGEFEAASKIEGAGGLDKVGKGKARRMRAWSVAKHLSGAPMLLEGAKYKKGLVAGQKAQMGVISADLESQATVRDAMARDIMEQKAMVEAAALYGSSIGGARDIYKGMRLGAENNPDAEIQLLDKDGNARALQGAEIKAYEQAQKEAGEKLTTAQTAVADAQRTGNKDQIEAAMAQLAEAKRNSDLLEQLISVTRDARGNIKSAQFAGVDGKGTWTVGEATQLSHLMWSNDRMNALRSGVRFKDGRQMMPLGKSGIVPDSEVRRHWLNSMTYADNKAAESNRMMLTRLGPSAPGTYTFYRERSDPDYGAQRATTVAGRQQQLAAIDPGNFNAQLDYLAGPADPRTGARRGGVQWQPGTTAQERRLINNYAAQVQVYQGIQDPGVKATVRQDLNAFYNNLVQALTPRVRGGLSQTVLDEEEVNI